MTTHLLSLFLVVLSVVSVSKPSSAVFLNIDCGGNASLTDANSLNWTGDADYVHNGVPQEVDSIYVSNDVLRTLRVFPTLKKNCYTINNLRKGEQVVIRASFYYANYDGKHSPPCFNLLLDGNFWAKVNVTAYPEDIVVYREVIYVTKGESASICLLQTMPGQLPFITALELHSLDPKMYRLGGANHFLITSNRVALGTLTDFRYPSDPYNRMWLAGPAWGNLEIVTQEAATIDVSAAINQPPEALFQYALAAPTTSDWGPILNTNLPEEMNIYINLYFSEVMQLNSTQKRSIQLYIGNQTYLDPIIPPFGSVLEVSITNITASPDTLFGLAAASDATLPPLLNGYEVFRVGHSLPNGTHINDVKGLVALQTAFSVLQKWTGDPCVPSPYWWEWIECSNDTIPRVTSLNLSGFGLSGSLPDFSSMDVLQTIDLHNNSLDGPIPEFLGSLPNLKLLNLVDNGFNGSIPASVKKKNLKLIITTNCLRGMACPLPPSPSPSPSPLPSPSLEAPPPPSTLLLSPTSSSTAPLPDLSNTPTNATLAPSANGDQKIAGELPRMLEATIQILVLSLLFRYC